MAAGVVGFAAGALLGSLAALAWARRGRAPTVAPGVAPHLLPDPALRWLLRAHGALGVWLAEIDREEQEPRMERVVLTDQLGPREIAAIDRRIERARDQEQSGGERVEGGTLLYRATDRVAVGLLLPGTPQRAELAQAEDDLERLLDGVRRRPQIIAMAQAQASGTALESLDSVGIRLAYQIERITGADVVVGATEPDGVRIVGVSGRGDQRLRDTLASPGSALARVAGGEAPQLAADADPLGGVVADRRRRSTPALVLPLTVTGTVVGAVAFWVPDTGDIPGPAMAEVMEALGNAAPRMANALQTRGLQQEASIDALTGLPNRRALDRKMHEIGVKRAALVYCDLDRFKVLNDTLGHAAGDAALAHFGRLLRDQVRGNDTAARIGGEEFALWLPESSLEVALKVADRVRLKLSTTPWDWRGRAWPLSASFGVAASPETSRHFENLPAQADAALYVAKQSGRDRVEAAGRASV